MKFFFLWFWGISVLLHTEPVPNEFEVLDVLSQKEFSERQSDS